MNKLKRILFAILLILLHGKLLAQMPNFFSKPAGSPKTTAPVPVASSPATAPPENRSTATATTSLYDPMMDNHMKAPPAGKEIGAFGMPVSRVEDMLRANGAKNYSYAFGKYSRLVISAYIVTIYFDRERLVGGIAIEPRPPYQTIEPEARAFFLDLFLNGADLSNFETNISGTRLELKYMP